MMSKISNLEITPAQLALDPCSGSIVVVDPNTGETLACGTGACATAVAGAITGRCGREVTLHLLGGDLKIEWCPADSHVYMTGGATTVFEGVYQRKS